MPNRRSILAAFAALPLFLSVAQAADSRPYDAAAFEAAIKTGKPLLVAIHADWCPTCSAQKPILKSLLDGKFNNMTALTVDFDKQKDVVRGFGAQLQSTLIVFRDGKEAGRSVGDTDPASIETLLAKAE